MKLDLEKAFGDVLDEKLDNSLPDPLRFSYIQANKKKSLETIQDSIGSSYETRPLLDIDVPKSNFTVRPMGRPEAEDWIVYQSIMNLLIEKIVKKLSERSYYRLIFLKPTKKTEPWLKFLKEQQNFYEKGSNFVVVTDIASYFENIDLSVLRSKIIDYLPEDKDLVEIVNLLFDKFLTTWSSGRVKGFGLPQGPSASSFLGELYLDEVDREMESEVGYIRYMDDIRIFCKKEIDAKKALLKLVKSLRKFKLNINAKKTKILSNSSIKDELFDNQEIILNAIDNVFNSGSRQGIKAWIPFLTKGIFLGGFSEKNFFGDRHIRFSLFRLELLKNSGINFKEDEVINQILSSFVSKPHMSNYFCRFLSLFPKDKRVRDFFFNFLRSKDNIYEWQEMHVLRALLDMNITWKREQLSWVFEKIKDKNKHWVLRSLYSLIAGKFGDMSDRRRIADLFDSLDKNELKRNFILSVQELTHSSRNHFYRGIESHIMPSGFIAYVKGLRNPLYFRSYERYDIKTSDEAVEESPY